MIEDLKTILVYISIELMKFIIIALKKAVIFFMGLVIMISSFFIGLKSEIPFIYVIFSLIVLIILLFFITENVFKRTQFSFNNNFVKFLLNENKPHIKTDFSKEKLKEIKREINTKKMSAMKRTILAIYINSINRKEEILKGDIKILKRELVKIHLAGYGLFFVLILFFELISLALAFANGIQTDFIIFLSLIGFVFAYALFSITIDPLLYLLIQKKVFEA